MERYFWCRSGEDGTDIEQLTKQQLEKRLADFVKDEEEPPTFLTRIPESDKGCWYANENAVVVIKGEIVVPKAVQVATRFEVD